MDMALLGRRFPLRLGSIHGALGKVGPGALEVKDGFLVDESALHVAAHGKKLKWQDGRDYQWSCKPNDPLGHSYQCGTEICQYYLNNLEP